MGVCGPTYYSHQQGGVPKKKFKKNIDSIYMAHIYQKYADRVWICSQIEARFSFLAFAFESQNAD
jgi:hypothetical protein